MSEAVELFGAEEVERGRRYHRPLYGALVLDLALSLGVLGLLALTRAGDWLLAPFDSLPWWLEAPLYAAAVLTVSALVRLPLSLWRDHLHERRWELSTQTLGAWLGDAAKALVVSAVLTAAVLTGLLGLVRLLPSAWPLVAAVAAALVVLLLGFVAPVLLEPIFNSFEPVEDRELHDGLRELAERAGVPVRDVLVSDASRRTTKANAYVSGIGATRRVVLFDTFLQASSPREIGVVIAHELAHRRERHVVKLTLLGMAGGAAAVVVLWLLLRSDRVLDAVGADGAGDPRVIPLVLLALSLIQLVALPPIAALSRRWERVADRFALELTRDPEAFESAFRTLVRSNVADLEPPRLLHALTATHPTVVERIGAIRRFDTVPK